MGSGPYVEVKVENVVNIANMGYLALLKPAESELVLPICIGPAEAQSIAAANNGITFPRPITHDLFCSVLDELQAEVKSILITSLKSGTFFARLMLESAAGESHEIDCRPSDGIALAVRQCAPILVHDSVIEAAAVCATQISSASHPQGGKKPAKKAKKEPPKKQLTPEEQLRESLAEAVRDERYEDAARIRDDLSRMHKEQN